MTSRRAAAAAPAIATPASVTIPPPRYPAKVAKTTDRVKGVESYLVIGPLADMSGRTNDSYVTSKVKARMLENDMVKALYIKVVTERSVVYLMGIVSRQEGDDAAGIAASTSDVARVVKVFEYTN